MASKGNLPVYPYGGTSGGLVSTNAAQTIRRSFAVAAGSFAVASRNMDVAQTERDRTDAIDGTLAGTKDAVQYDQNGRLLPPTYTGDPHTAFGHAYNEAIVVNYGTAMLADAQSMADALKRESPNNPEGFRQGWNSYFSTLRSQVPPVLWERFEPALHRVGVENYGLMADAHHETMRTQAIANLNAGVTKRVDEAMNSVAASSGIDNHSEEVISQVYGEIYSLYQSAMTLDPVNYWPEKIEHLMLEHRKTIEGYAFIRGAMNLANQMVEIDGVVQPNTDAAMRYISSFVQNPNDLFNEEERRQRAAIAEQMIGMIVDEGNQSRTRQRLQQTINAADIDAALDSLGPRLQTLGNPGAAVPDPYDGGEGLDTLLGGGATPSASNDMLSVYNEERQKILDANVGAAERVRLLEKLDSIFATEIAARSTAQRKATQQNTVDNYVISIQQTTNLDDLDALMDEFGEGSAILYLPSEMDQQQKDYQAVRVAYFSQRNKLIDAEYENVKNQLVDEKRRELSRLVRDTPPEQLEAALIEWEAAIEAWTLGDEGGIAFKDPAGRYGFMEEIRNLVNPEIESAIGDSDDALVERNGQALVSNVSVLMSASDPAFVHQRGLTRVYSGYSDSEIDGTWEHFIRNSGVADGDILDERNVRMWAHALDQMNGRGPSVETMSLRNGQTFHTPLQEIYDRVTNMRFKNLDELADMAAMYEILQSANGGAFPADPKYQDVANLMKDMIIVSNKEEAWLKYRARQSERQASTWGKEWLSELDMNPETSREFFLGVAEDFNGLMARGPDWWKTFAGEDRYSFNAMFPQDARGTMLGQAARMYWNYNPVTANLLGTLSGPSVPMASGTDEFGNPVTMAAFSPAMMADMRAIGAKLVGERLTPGSDQFNMALYSELSMRGWSLTDMNGGGDGNYRWTVKGVETMYNQTGEVITEALAFDMIDLVRSLKPSNLDGFTAKDLMGDPTILGIELPVLFDRSTIESLGAQTRELIRDQMGVIEDEPVDIRDLSDEALYSLFTDLVDNGSLTVVFNGVGAERGKRLDLYKLTYHAADGQIIPIRSDWLFNSRGYYDRKVQWEVDHVTPRVRLPREGFNAVP